MAFDNPVILRPLVIRRLRSEGYSAELIPDELITHAALTYFNEEVVNSVGDDMPPTDEIVDNICKTFYRELNRIFSTNQM